MTALDISRQRPTATCECASQISFLDLQRMLPLSLVGSADKDMHLKSQCPASTTLSAGQDNCRATSQCVFVFS